MPVYAGIFYLYWIDRMFKLVKEIDKKFKYFTKKESQNSK